MGLVGALGFLRPESWALLYDDGGEIARRHIQGRLHLKDTIRLFASCLVGYAYIVHVARRISDGAVRRAVVRGLLLSSLLASYALFRAQLRGDTMSRGALGALFTGSSVAVTCGYAWFAILEKPVVFTELGRDA